MTAAAHRVPAEIIRWEKPPPPGRGGRGGRKTDRYDKVVAELQARPGEWAVVQESADPQPGLANHIRVGSIAAFAPRGDFDAVQRKVGDRYCIYAAYYGDGEEP